MFSTSKDWCNAYVMNVHKTPNTEDFDSIFMTYVSTAAIKSAQITYSFPLF